VYVSFFYSLTPCLYLLSLSHTESLLNFQESIPSNSPFLNQPQEAEQRGPQAAHHQAEQGEGGGEEEHDTQEREEERKCDKKTARTGQ
jgi:hypothetical protein